MKLGPRTRRRGQIAKILARKRETVARLRAAPPLPARHAPRRGALEARVRGARAEVVVSPTFDPRGALEAFVACDVALGGSFDALSDLRDRLESDSPDTRLVAVDFVVHPIQLERAAASGADAALLVARLVDAEGLAALVAKARALGLEPLVEVASEQELARALDLRVVAIAVSIRDRDHGRPEIERAISLAHAAGSEIRRVALEAPLDAADELAEAFDVVVVAPEAPPVEPIP